MAKSISLIFTLGLIAISISGCTKRVEPGFALEGSKIRYETVKFESPDVMAEVNGFKITYDQILDKSSVMKDLAKQENEVMIGLAYLKILEKLTDATLSHSNTVEIFLPNPTTTLESILSRLGQKPRSGFDVAYAKSPDSKQLARLKSLHVTRDEIDYDHFVLKSLEKRRFAEMASQFNSQISRVLLNEEAGKVKKPLQDYLNETVFGGRKTDVSDSELLAYFKQIGFSESELTPEMREQFISGLRQRKEESQIETYVAEKLLSGPVKVAFHEPFATVRLDPEWGPEIGTADAPVSIVAFGGTTCPDCTDFIDLVSQVMDKHAGYLKLNWIHTFGTSDGIANMLSEGALCIEAQRPGKSLEFIKDFAPKASQSDENAFYQWAKTHRLSEDKFKECFLGGKTRVLLEKQQAYARKIGIVANPTIWIDGVLIEGAVHRDDVERVVNQRISQHGSSWFGAFLRRIKARF